MSVFFSIFCFISLFIKECAGPPPRKPPPKPTPPFVPGGCPRDWIYDIRYPNICYLSRTINNTFIAAGSECVSSFGSAVTLPIFYTNSEYLSYQELALDYFSTGFTCQDYNWLGIASRDTSKWTDGTAVTLSYWMANNGGNNCSIHLATGGSWKSASCSDSYFYVCQQRINSITVGPTTTLPTGNCAAGWMSDIYGICYTYSYNYMTWDCAEAYCETLGATLPRFNNDSELVSYYTVLQQMFIKCTTYQWLGFYDPNADGSFEWINGSSVAVNDPNWYVIPGSNAVFGTSLGWIFDYDKSYDAFIVYDTFPFLCQIRPSSNTFNTVYNTIFTSNSSKCNFATSTTSTSTAATSAARVSAAVNTEPTAISSTQPTGTTQPTKSPSAGLTTQLSYAGTSCPVGWLNDILYPNICYYLVTGSTVLYQTASDYCQQNLLGSSLPVFHTSDEYDSYHQLMLWRTGNFICTNQLWLGISNTNYSNWVDGTYVSFSYWGSSISNGSNCINHYATGGRWKAYSCNSAYFNFACQLRLTQSTATISPPIPTPTPSGSCPPKWSADSYGICYRYNVTATTWDQAEAYCESQGGTLVRFCNSSEQKSFWKTLAAMYIPCNSIYWVGIYDLYGNGSFQYINGSYIKNPEWYSSLLKCDFSATRVASHGWFYNGSSYIQYNTTTVYPFICQIRPAGNDCFTNPVVQAPITNSICNPSIITASTTTTIRKNNSTSTTTTIYMTTNVTTKNIAKTTLNNPTTVATSYLHQSTLQNVSDIIETIASPITTSKNIFSLTPSLAQMGFEQNDANNQVALIAKVQDTATFVMQSLNDSMKQQLGYTFEQLVMSSSFNTVPCDHSDYQDLYNPLLGNCYTFNAGENPKHWSVRPGSLTGLRLVLAALQADYTCTATYAGFKLVIQENNIMPFPDAEGFTVPLGTTSLISVQQQRISRLSSPYGNCAPSNFGIFVNNYSVEACQRFCFQTNLMESCNCADPRYPLPSGENYCSYLQKPCLDFNQACESVISEECNCPPPCNQVIFTATLTSSKLITRDFETNYCNDSNNANQSVCDGNFDENFAVVYVYYEQMNVLVSTQVSSYGLYPLFCDFSNMLGTLLGIGILTFVEIACIITLIIYKCMQKVKLIFM